jgi:KipI family sensor histidine kinase inhibitor
VTTPQIAAWGDACLSVVFEERIDPSVNDRCIAIGIDLERRRIAGVRDVVPAYHTVSVHFDPTQINRSTLRQELEQAIGAVADAAPSPESDPIQISVRYGGEDGPDLASVAEFSSSSEEDVIRLHTQTVYRVYMLGFLPGFAYLGSVDRRIAVPRLGTPRARVPAGSVGIAGAQTGIYPIQSPGGWRVIGRTSMTLFDSTRVEPSMLKAGDRVRFVAV